MLANLRLRLLAHLQLVLKKLVGVFRLLVDVADVEEFIAWCHLVEVRLWALLSICTIWLHHLFFILLVPFSDVLVGFGPVLLAVNTALGRRSLLLAAGPGFLGIVARAHIHLLLQEAFVQTSTSLLLL